MNEPTLSPRSDQILVREAVKLAPGAALVLFFVGMIISKSVLVGILAAFLFIPTVAALYALFMLGKFFVHHPPRARHFSALGRGLVAGVRGAGRGLVTLLKATPALAYAAVAWLVIAGLLGQLLPAVGLLLVAGLGYGLYRGRHVFSARNLARLGTGISRGLSTLVQRLAQIWQPLALGLLVYLIYVCAAHLGANVFTAVVWAGFIAIVGWLSYIAIEYVFDSERTDINPDLRRAGLAAHSLAALERADQREITVLETAQAKFEADKRKNPLIADSARSWNKLKKSQKEAYLDQARKEI
jgi:hypothetical protein